MTKDFYSTNYPLMVVNLDDTNWSDRVVTQGHSDYCAEHGHAEHYAHGGLQPLCVRCGYRFPTDYRSIAVRFTTATSPEEAAGIGFHAQSHGNIVTTSN